MKRIFALLITLIICVSSFVASAYNVNDAYDEILAKHPDFLAKLSTQNITKEKLISFILDMQTYLNEMDKETKITEENFEKNAVKAVIMVSSREEHFDLQDALIILFPDAVKSVIAEGKIPSEFRPLVDTVKRIIFQNNMIGEVTPSVTKPYENEEARFTDIDSSFWCYEAICTLADNFILNGYLDRTFKPNVSITRAEFAKIIVSAAEKLDVGAESTFSDVTKDDWHYNYVSSAVKNGYIKGYPDNTFRPDENITRADLCTVVYRCVKDSLEKAEARVFVDENMIAPYAKEGVQALSSNGIISGFEDGSFKPLEPATRAQTAKIIYSVFFEKN